MSFQMVHMEIAYRLLELFPQIEHAPEFILGSVAPDSVHMSPHYDVAMKVSSHMFEGCGKWSDTQDYPRWRQNINNTFSNRIDGKEQSGYRDFILGLCVHCLTDYWNDLHIWRELQSRFIPPMSLDAFKSAYYPEARGTDLWLYQNSKNTGAIRDMLSKAAAFDVTGLVNKANVEKQQDHLLNVQYTADKVDPSNYHLLSTDMIEQFIKNTVTIIFPTIMKWNMDAQNGGLL